jgi:hypothetical protein
MNKTVHYVGLDVHKETLAVAIAPADNTASDPTNAIREINSRAQTSCAELLLA